MRSSYLRITLPATIGLALGLLGCNDGTSPGEQITVPRSETPAGQTAALRSEAFLTMIFGDASGQLSGAAPTFEACEAAFEAPATFRFRLLQTGGLTNAAEVVQEYRPTLERSGDQRIATAIASGTPETVAVRSEEAYKEEAIRYLSEPHLTETVGAFQGPDRWRFLDDWGVEKIFVGDRAWEREGQGDWRVDNSELANTTRGVEAEDICPFLSALREEPSLTITREMINGVPVLHYHLEFKSVGDRFSDEGTGEMTGDVWIDEETFWPLRQTNRLASSTGPSDVTTELTNSMEIFDLNDPSIQIDEPLP